MENAYMTTKEGDYQIIDWSIEGRVFLKYVGEKNQLQLVYVGDGNDWTIARISPPFQGLIFEKSSV
jgi:hypothetical protein